MTPEDANFLIEKIAIPLLLSISAWLLKDVAVGLYVARREESRREWLFQLREIYQPLFFWSGVVQFSGSTSERQNSIREFSAALSKAVTLVPHKHYYTLIRVLEQASDQQTSPPTHKQLSAARDYIYSKIEILNFALFKQTPQFDPVQYADGLSSFRAAMRVALSAATHLVSWGLIVGVLYSFYRALEGNPSVSMAIMALSILFVAGELVRRVRLSIALSKKLRN
jgi:hypothetical protein